MWPTPNGKIKAERDTRLRHALMQPCRLLVISVDRDSRES